MWDERVIGTSALAAYGVAHGEASLADRCAALLAQQRAVWPRLAEGTEALARIETRQLPLNNWPVSVQFNPARATSSLAKVDAVSIAKRPCFLCAENLPAEQRGVRFGRYLLLPNPAPIVQDHLTVALDAHAPQRFGEHLEAFLELARALSARFTVLYNGPRSGASAPDHMHFQAIPVGAMPLEANLCYAHRELDVERPDGTLVRVVSDAPDQETHTRHAVTVAGYNASSITSAVRSIVAALPLDEQAGEPQLNAYAQHQAGAWTVVIFPRRRHRPACYDAPDEQRVSLSPGILDMAGIVVTVRREDFDRVDGDVLTTAYRDVTGTLDKSLAAVAGVARASGQ
jgi:hypothetical protein